VRRRDNELAARYLPHSTVRSKTLSLAWAPFSGHDRHWPDRRAVPGPPAPAPVSSHFASAGP